MVSFFRKTRKKFVQEKTQNNEYPVSNIEFETEKRFCENNYELEPSNNGEDF